MICNTLHELLSSAKEVVANWAHGDLAHAVRRLDAALKKSETGPEPESDPPDESGAPGNDRFLVQWSMDARAETNHAAAKEAFANIKAPETRAAVFDVWRGGEGKPYTMDLAGPEITTEPVVLNRKIGLLSKAAKEVVESWGHGDLAHAVRRLDAAVGSIEEEFGTDPNRRLVSWGIDIWAPSHMEAARDALAALRDPYTTATHFLVWRPGAEPDPIDLTMEGKPRNRTYSPEP